MEFNTDDAVITVDGALATESDLGIGMVVAIEGTFDTNGLTGKADRIIYEELLEGQVDLIDLVNDSFVVLGQTVFTNNDTVFVGATFGTLLLGSIVEVSGLKTSSGEIEATRIELKSGVTEFEITGIVENLIPLDMTFTIGDVVIDYSNAILDGLPDDTLSDGLLVEVESREGIRDGALIASRVELQVSILEGAEGLLAEIGGFVTDFISLSDFAVNGIPVRADNETTYEHGFASNIAPDVKLEVEGSIVGGVVLADEIEFRVDNAVDIEANVKAVDPINRTLVLLGITANVNDLTEFRDASNARVEPFGLEDIQIGDEIEISGLLEDNTVIATRVLRMDPVSKVSLLGPVEAISDPIIEILGVTALSSNETAFLDLNGLPITAADFFATVEIGSIVEAEGELLGGNIINSVEIEFE